MNGIHGVSIVEVPTVLMASPTLAKIVQAKMGKPGAILEFKIDNRYKDGNFRIVKGVVRGNKNTLWIEEKKPK